MGLNEPNVERELEDIKNKLSKMEKQSRYDIRIIAFMLNDRGEEEIIRKLKAEGWRNVSISHNTWEIYEAYPTVTVTLIP